MNERMKTHYVGDSCEGGHRTMTTDELHELAALCMAKVACSECGGNGVSKFDCLCHGGGMATKGCSPCELCKTEGEILDPQLANLRMVLWRQCSGCLYDIEASRNGMYGVYRHQDNCTGYVRRTWDGPDWWLGTLVKEAAHKDGVDVTRLMYPVNKSASEVIVSAVLEALKVKA